MMEFMMTVLATALGFLLAMVAMYAVMLQPKVMDWVMRKTMDASMKYIERISEMEDKDL